MVARIFLSLLFLLSGAFAHAQDIIGLSLPLSGRLSPVAERIEFGALAAVNKLKANGRDIRLVLVDDGCDERKVPEVVEKLRTERVKIVVGPVCFDVAKQIAASVNDEDGATVPVIALNTRNPLLQRNRDNDGLPLFEVSNGSEDEARAAVEQILPRFVGKPFAILDDGSVYGRGLADQVRLLAQEAGLTPVENANFRPLQTTQMSILRRLKRSGVEALFIAASPEDIVTISNDLKSLQYGWIMGVGETAQLLPFALNAGAVPEGLLMVRPRDIPTGDAVELLAKLKNDKVEVEDSLLLGHALVEIAAEFVNDSETGLQNKSFETVIGDVSFDAGGRAKPTPFALYRWQNGTFEPLEQ